MDWKLFIARRIYRSNEGGKEVSKPAVRIAMLGIAIGLAVMIVSNLEQIKKDLETKKSNLKSYVTQLDQNLSEIEQNIADLKSQITAKEEEITQTQEELDAAQAKEDAQKDAMIRRIRVMYEKGDSYILDMMLKAESFSDFLPSHTSQS